MLILTFFGVHSMNFNIFIDLYNHHRKKDKEGSTTTTSWPPNSPQKNSLIVTPRSIQNPWQPQI